MRTAPDVIVRPERRWQYLSTATRSKPTSRPACARCKALEVANRPDIKNGTPSSWEACIAMGINPIDGSPLIETGAW